MRHQIPCHIDLFQGGPQLTLGAQGPRQYFPRRSLLIHDLFFLEFAGRLASEHLLAGRISFFQDRAASDRRFWAMFP